METINAHTPEADNLAALLEELPQFSLFEAPISNVYPAASINIIDLYQRITGDEGLKHTCTKIRRLASKKERDMVKDAELACATPSGAFSYRSDKSLLIHTGYLCVDIDHLTPNQAKRLKSRLIEDKSIPTLLIFLSPSETGLKWIIRIPPDPESHKKYFEAMERYFQVHHAISIDESCCNVSRACYLSFDPEAYLAPDFLQVQPLGEQFLKQWLPEPLEPPNVPWYEAPPDQEQRIRQVELLIHQIHAAQKDITADYKNWLRIGFALCELGEQGRPYFHQISQYYPQYDKREADDKFTGMLDSYDGRTGLGTLFHIAKGFGIYCSEEAAAAVTKPGEGTETPVGPLSPAVSGTGPRTAMQRMEDAQNQPPIKKLVGTLWHTGELHILFGDNGTGKSVWAVQIADAITKGESALPTLSNENTPLRVLYYDFELSDTQFQNRYLNDTGEPYAFSELLLFCKIDFQRQKQRGHRGGSDEFIIDQIEADIRKLQPQVLIIDNLSYLKTETTQDAKVALDLVKKLNDLKRRYNLSILALSHTPKTKTGVPITNNDLAGSKQLSNLVDSISAIGKSARNREEKYIKQIKCRTGENLYDAESVITCHLHKDDNFLRFTCRGLDNEHDHIRELDNGQKAIEKAVKKAQVLDLRSQGQSLRDIAKEVGVGKSTIERWLKEESEE